MQQHDELPITNVTSRSFGIVDLDTTTNEEYVRNLIRINEAVPAEVTFTFLTVDHNQETARIRLMENKSSDNRAKINDCEEVGNLVLEMPLRLPANSPIEITFRLNEQGRLHITTKELSTDKVVEVDIQTIRIIVQEKLDEAKAR